MDIFDYIKNYGNIEILKINDVDALIFARLSYLHWEMIKDKFPIKIEDVTKYLKIMKNNKLDDKLIIVLNKSKRFKNLVFTRFKSVLDEQRKEQFAALTIKFKDNTSFISYRGTTKNIVAYQEDLNMSYKIVPAQRDALKYLMNEKDKYLYVGGHSKGGNLSMYASIYSSFFIRHKIQKVYNFDGPGFLKIDSNFNRLKKKIVNICPENDIVGSLLYNNAPKLYIKTLKKGIESHNLYHWQIENTHFVLGKNTKDSEAFYYANIDVVTSISLEKKKIVLDYLFNLMEKRSFDTIKELTIDDLKKIIYDIPNLEKEEKEKLIKMFKLFLKLAFLEKITSKKNLHQKN